MDAAQIVAAIVLAVLIIGPVAIVAWGWTGWLRKRPKPFPYGAGVDVDGESRTRMPPGDESPYLSTPRRSCIPNFCEAFSATRTSNPIVCQSFSESRPLNLV